MLHFIKVIRRAHINTTNLYAFQLTSGLTHFLAEVTASEQKKKGEKRKTLFVTADFKFPLPWRHCMDEPAGFHRAAITQEAQCKLTRQLAAWYRQIIIINNSNDNNSNNDKFLVEALSADSDSGGKGSETVVQNLRSHWNQWHRQESFALLACKRIWWPNRTRILLLQVFMIRVGTLVHNHFTLTASSSTHMFLSAFVSTESWASAVSIMPWRMQPHARRSVALPALFTASRAHPHCWAAARGKFIMTLKGAERP